MPPSKRFRFPEGLSDPPAIGAGRVGALDEQGERGSRSRHSGGGIAIRAWPVETIRLGANGCSTRHRAERFACNQGSIGRSACPEKRRQTRPDFVQKDVRDLLQEAKQPRVVVDGANLIDEDDAACVQARRQRQVPRPVARRCTHGTDDRSARSDVIGMWRENKSRPASGLLRAQCRAEVAPDEITGITDHRARREYPSP